MTRLRPPPSKLPPRVLALCLAIASEADTRQLHPNTFGVARL